MSKAPVEPQVVQTLKVFTNLYEHVCTGWKVKLLKGTEAVQPVGATFFRVAGLLMKP